MTSRQRIALVGCLAFTVGIVAAQGYAAHGWLGIPVYVATAAILLPLLGAVIAAVDRWVDRG